MQFNKGHIPASDIGKLVYEEDDVQFFQRCSLRLNGPPPAPLEPGIQRTAPENVALPDTFYDRELGLGSNTATLHPTIVKILKKIEDRTFVGSARQYDVFKTFDRDRDGYVSATDFTEHVKQMSVLNDKELGCLLDYVDPERKGSLSFAEFS